MQLLEVDSACKNDRFRYTVSHRSNVEPITTKRKALQLYLEGLGFQAIGRILNISYRQFINV
jgi:transposase-like protein